MDAQGPYAKDFGPFDGHHWMKTARKGALPRAAVDPHGQHSKKR